VDASPKSPKKPRILAEESMAPNNKKSRNGV
jgi:hypothetical protein